LSSVPGVPLLSALPLGRACFRLNNPSPCRIEKLHSNRIAVAMHWLAVSHSRQRTKLSGARYKRQRLAFFPPPAADHPCSSRTNIFRKSRFRAWRLLMPVQHHRYLHWDPPVRSVKRKSRFEGHGSCHPLTNTPQCASNCGRCRRGSSCRTTHGPPLPATAPACRRLPEKPQLQR
jgi:hypothetical protein